MLKSSSAGGLGSLVGLDISLILAKDVRGFLLTASINGSAPTNDACRGIQHACNTHDCMSDNPSA